jgi:flagellar assembly protein FliH
MSTPRKFLFDQSFDAPDPPRGTARKAQAPPPPEPTFTRAELEAARAASASEGRTVALAEAARAIEAQAAATLLRLDAALAALLDARARMAEEAQRRAVELTRAIVGKAVPALTRKAPLLEIEAMVADCLREAFDEPRIVLRVADALFEALQKRLGALTTATGFAGRIVLLADETLGPGDARVEWADGGAERDTGRLMRDIDGALARALDTIPVQGTSPLEENKP